MINKQLETNVNREKILQDLANNLGIDFVTEGSTLKKIADTYSAENLNFATNVDDAIANGFLSTMSSEYLEMFGRQNGIHRKNYNNISVYSHQEAVTISVEKETLMVSDLSGPVMLFNKGSIIYSDDNLMIESLSQVVISDINEIVPISVRISLMIGVESYTIDEGSIFLVQSSNVNVINDIPNLNLTFTKAVGLALLQEFEEDYRLRIYEASYVANNGANSLISSITKEVPFIHFIETEDYKDGRAIRVIYPYTKEIIDTGYDEYIDNLIIPLVETNLKGKVLYGQLIEVKKPEPMLLSINIELNNQYYNITESYMNNIVVGFNNVFSTYKEINRFDLESYVRTELALQTDAIKNIDFIFTSPYVSEETFNLTDEYGSISIPKGRFLHLTSITKDTGPIYVG